MVDIVRRQTNGGLSATLDLGNILLKKLKILSHPLIMTGSFTAYVSATYLPFVIDRATVCWKHDFTVTVFPQIVKTYPMIDFLLSI